MRCRALNGAKKGNSLDHVLILPDGDGTDGASRFMPKPGSQATAMVAKSRRADAQPALLLFFSIPAAYVVERGLTAMAVAGTTLPVPVYVHPRSFPPAETGVHDGRPGLICCVSVSEVVLM